MPTKDEIIKYLQENEAFLKKLKIKKIGLFGSYARDEQTEESDIDFFVEAPADIKKLIQVENFLSEKFHKKVDVIRKHENLKKKVFEIYF